MRSGHGWWITLAILIVSPVLGILGWEAVQRYRYHVTEARIAAGLAEFQRKVDFSGNGGPQLMLPGQKPQGDGRFTIGVQSGEGVPKRYAIWELYSPLVNPDGELDMLCVTVELYQEQGPPTGSPEVQVTFNSRRHPAVESLLRQSLQDVQHFYGTWDEWAALHPPQH